MKTQSLFLLLVCFSLSFADEWKQERTKNGIQIFSRHYNNANLKETKGTTIFNAPLAEVVAAIEDVEKRTTWFDVYKSAQRIDHKGGTLIHTVTNMPFPLKERETIWERTEVAYDSINGIYRNVFYAVSQTEYPLTSHHVRIIDGRGEWRARSVSPTTTEVTYQFGCDPAGGIPTSFANGASNSIPVKTLKAIQKAMDSHYYSQEQGVVVSQ